MKMKSERWDVRGLVSIIQDAAIHNIIEIFPLKMKNNPRVKLYRFTLFLIIIVAFGGCNWHKNRLQVDVSSVTIADVKIHRYDQDLFNVPVTDLKAGL